MSVFGTKQTSTFVAIKSAFDPKRTFASPLLKRQYRVNLLEHLLHDYLGWRLAVE